jgi:hypothetical protein
MSIVVGESRPVQVIDMATGAVIPGVPITSSDPSVVAVSGGDPPAVTGLLPGHVTLQAGPASADVTVFAGPVLPLGTIRWTAPSDGSGLRKTVSAIPTDNPAAIADVFTLGQSGRVQALTSDGMLVWVAPLDTEVNDIVPDMRGGMLAVRGGSVTRLDPATGQPAWQYVATFQPGISMYPDGTIAVVEVDYGAPAAFVTGLAPDSGAVVFRVQLENGHISTGANCENDAYEADTIPGTSRLAVTEQGIGYLIYSNGTVTSSADGSCGFTASQTGRMKLLRVTSDGTSASATLHSWTSSSSAHWNGCAYVFDTDAPVPSWASPDLSAAYDDGTVFAWSLGTPSYEAHCDCLACTPPVPPTFQTWLTRTSGLSLVSESPVDGVVSTPLIVGDDDTVYAGMQSTPEPWAPKSFAALSPAGSVLWSVPGTFEPLAAIAGGVVAARALQDTGEQLAMFDSSGTPAYNALGSQLQYSWLGDWYANSDTSGVSIASVAGPLLDLADSLWGVNGGNLSGTSAAARPLNHAIRDRIAQLARGYESSESWLDAPETGNKCNIFVHDVLQQAGTDPPYATNWKREVLYLLNLTNYLYYPALAGDWANPSKQLKCWQYVPEGPDASLAGDVIAEAIQYSDATGHVGIIVGQPETASADSTAAPPGKITITNYGFRPDNPDPQVHGQKRYAVVKRFVCN